MSSERRNARLGPRPNHVPPALPGYGPVRHNQPQTGTLPIVGVPSMALGQLRRFDPPPRGDITRTSTNVSTELKTDQRDRDVAAFPTTLNVTVHVVQPHESTAETMTLTAGTPMLLFPIADRDAPRGENVVEVRGGRIRFNGPELRVPIPPADRRRCDTPEQHYLAYVGGTDAAYGATLEEFRRKYATVQMPRLTAPTTVHELQADCAAGQTVAAHVEADVIDAHDMAKRGYLSFVAEPTTVTFGATPTFTAGANAIALSARVRLALENTNTCRVMLSDSTGAPAGAPVCAGITTAVDRTTWYLDAHVRCGDQGQFHLMRGGVLNVPTLATGQGMMASRVSVSPFTAVSLGLTTGAVGPGVIVGIENV
jgi:hypothetical protein